MENPFQILSQRLSNIESLLLDIKHKETPERSYTISEIAYCTGYDELTLLNFIEEGRLKKEKEVNKTFNEHSIVKIGDKIKYPFNGDKKIMLELTITNFYPNSYNGDGCFRIKGIYPNSKHEFNRIVKYSAIAKYNKKYK